MDMDDKNNEMLTPDTFGEMYIRQRLEEGLFSDERLGLVRYVEGRANERELQADDFAREVGRLMMPYLGSHPDIGFESFRQSVRHLVKQSAVYRHCEKLTDEYPHRQITDAIDNACEAIGSRNPEDMLIYVRLGKGQKMLMLQYRDLNQHMIMNRGAKRHNLCIAFDEDADAGRKEDEGAVYVWLGR